MSKLSVLKLSTSLKRQIQIMEMLEILKEIAISEYQYLEKERKEAGKFLYLIGSFINFHKAKNIKKPFIKNDSQNIGIVGVGSDEGFLGALSNQIVDNAIALHKKNPGSALIAVGKRAARRMREAGFDPVEFAGIPFPLEYDAVIPLKNYLMQEYSRNRLGGVKMVFIRCHSFARQTMEVQELLPFNILELGQTSKVHYDDKVEELQYVEIEPSLERVLEYLVALTFGRQIYDIFWNSKLAEVAGRAMELNERSNNLQKKNDKIKIRLFRANHEVIDAGIREVFSGHHHFEKLKKKAGAI